MGDRDHGRDHSHVSGDGEHARDPDPDSERGHDHETSTHDEPGDDAHHAEDVSTFGVAILTVSSSRTLDDDPSGDAIAEGLTAAGGDVVTRELVADDFDSVQGSVANFTRRDDVDVVVTTGGTGVTPDDVTPDAIEPMLAKRLPGFGEEFRRRSIEDVGPMGLVSRATAGVSNETIVVTLPGSEPAARTGVDLLTSVVDHLVGLARSD